MANEFKANKAVLSCSGGLDSSCLLLKLLAEGKEVRCYSFDYGQKHRIELEKIKKNIAFLQAKGLPVSHQIVNMVDVFSGNTSSLVASTGKEIPHGHYAAENMKSTVVENRNVIFSSIIYGKALSWANKTNSNVIISLGIHAGDHTIYPDCTPESQQAAKHLFEISNWNSDRVTYEAPFVNIHKGEVLAVGLTCMQTMGFTKAQKKRILKKLLRDDVFSFK
jgi:7-cyano-7-deazaguanine synthase